MAKTLSNSGQNFLLQEGLNYLHKQTTDWLSELEFYGTEFIFFTKLLDKAYLRTGSSKKSAELNLIFQKLKSFRVEMLQKLADTLSLHERHLASLDLNVFAQNEYAIRQEHEQCRHDMIALTDSIRKIKKEIFNIVEKQLKQINKISKGFEEGSIVL